MNWTYFEVQGKGAIPFDMLRYDSCYPATSQDAAVIEVAASPYASQEERREVATVGLVHCCNRKGWQPTVARWASFLWAVVPDSVRSY